MENIKKLREKTGAGIVDCKEALKEANNDIEKASEILRKKGIAKASKRNDNEASEGMIKVEVSGDNKIAYILQVNSETDFVAKNDKFQKFTEDILGIIKDKKPKNIEELNELQLRVDTVKKELDNLSGVIGEKLEISKFNILEGVSVSGYS
ncbi:translation elongation factor Ts, partial [bacterium]|nr:translation elongation factor Ts [bacterium]